MRCMLPRLPIFACAHPHATGTCRLGAVLDLLCGHRAKGGLHHVRVIRQIERCQQPVAQMGELAMRVDPAVACLMVAGQRIPGHSFLAVDPQELGGCHAERCMIPVDMYRLRRPAARLVQGRCGQPNQALSRRCHIRDGLFGRKPAGAVRDSDTVPVGTWPAQHSRQRLPYPLRRSHSFTGRRTMMPTAPARASSSSMDIGIMSPRAHNSAR